MFKRLNFCHFFSNLHQNIQKGEEENKSEEKYEIAIFRLHDYNFRFQVIILISGKIILSKKNEHEV